jgi:NADPH-dependent 2,4-dienoyl-CoA reductase/sulfur reductase-like enzyme
VIATGSTPRALPLFDGAHGAHVLRSLEHALALKDALAGAARVVVVGAGFIGSEVASSARSRGVEVTVVELEPVPLSRVFGARLGSVFAALHRDHGTDLRLDTSVERFDVDSTGHIARVHLTDDTSVEADLVVVGIGGAPTVGWLEGSGLELGNGIACDASLSPAPGIFAVGDVCNWPNELFGRRMRVEQWTNASEQGQHVARSIVHGTQEPYRSAGYVWSNQYGTMIQCTGITDGEMTVVDGSLQSDQFLAWFARDGILVGALALRTPKLLMLSRRLVDARCPLTEALERLI